MFLWQCPECEENGIRKTERESRFALYVHLISKTGRNSTKARELANSESAVRTVDGMEDIEQEIA